MSKLNPILDVLPRGEPRGRSYFQRIEFEDSDSLLLKIGAAYRPLSLIKESISVFKEHRTKHAQGCPRFIICPDEFRFLT